MCIRALLIFIILTVTGITTAEQREGDLAVLDIKAGTKLPEEIKLDLLSKVVREVGVKATPYRVMTKENVFAILRDKGIDPNKCGDVECEVEFGRVLQADKLVVGELSFVEGVYYLNLSMYDTSTAAIDRTISRECKGCVFSDLMTLVRSTSMELFGSVEQRRVEKEIGGEKEAWELRGVEEVVVKFESEPEGAMVEIAGKPVCETPCSRFLQEGAYRVAMKKPRYLPYEQDIVVKKGMEAISGKLEPDFGWLNVSSTPGGLDVYINGSPSGKTPIEKMELSPGVYDVIVRDVRYYEKGKRVNIERGKEKDVSVVLQPREGGIRVRAYDEKGNAIEGDVYIDGKKAGRAPGSFKVIIGEHNVKVVAENGAWFEKRAMVSEKKETIIDATIKIKPIEAKPEETREAVKKRESELVGIYIYPAINYYLSEIGGINYGAGLGYKFRMPFLLTFGTQFTVGELSKDGGLRGSSSFVEIYTMVGFGRFYGGYIKPGFNYQVVSGEGTKKQGFGTRLEAGGFGYHKPICLFAGFFIDSETYGIALSLGGYF